MRTMGNKVGTPPLGGPAQTPSSYAYPQGAPPGYPPYGHYPPSGYYPSPQGMPPPYWGPPVRPQLPYHPKAIPGLVMGIIALSLNLVTFFLASTVYCGILAFFTAIASIILGIIAVVFARKAKAEIEASPGRYRGDGQATGAFVCGLIGAILGGLLFIVGVGIVVLIIVMFSYPGFFFW